MVLLQSKQNDPVCLEDVYASLQTTPKPDEADRCLHGIVDGYCPQCLQILSDAVESVGRKCMRLLQRIAERPLPDDPRTTSEFFAVVAEMPDEVVPTPPPENRSYRRLPREHEDRRRVRESLRASQPMSPEENESWKAAVRDYRRMLLRSLEEDGLIGALRSTHPD